MSDSDSDPEPPFQPNFDVSDDEEDQNQPVYPQNQPNFEGFGFEQLSDSGSSDVDPIFQPNFNVSDSDDGHQYPPSGSSSGSHVSAIFQPNFDVSTSDDEFQPNLNPNQEHLNDFGVFQLHEIDDDMARMMLYDETELNEWEEKSYQKYCQIDIRNLWGWGMGWCYDEGIDLYYASNPWNYMVRVQKEKTPFFIDHTRRTTQWIKPAQLYRGMRQLNTAEGEMPKYVMLYTEYKGAEFPKKTITNRRFEMGEYVCSPNAHEWRLMPPEYEICRTEPNNTPLEPHMAEEHIYKEECSIVGVGEIFFIHHPTQFICPREIIAGIGRLIEDQQLQDFYANQFFSTVCVINRRNYIDYDTEDFFVSVIFHRDHIMRDTYEHIMVNMSGVQLRRQLRIRIVGEIGIDAGGLFNEWITELGSLLTTRTPILGDIGNGEIGISRLASGYAREKIMMFRFIGRLIAIAIVHDTPLGVPFCGPLLKMIKTGKKVTLDDWIKGWQDDPELSTVFNLPLLEKKDYKFPVILQWTVQTREDRPYWVAEEYNQHALGGRVGDVAFEDIPIYVDEYTQWRFSSGRENVLAIRQGIGDVFPLEMLNYITLDQFRLLVCGNLQPVDVQAWRDRTVYGHNLSPQTVHFFWAYIESIDDKKRRQVLQFVTGKSVLPAGGFAAFFEGGYMKLEVRNVIDEANVGYVYPQGHTCTSTLDLPNYKTLEQLVDRMDGALAEGMAMHLL